MGEHLEPPSQPEPPSAARLDAAFRLLGLTLGVIVGVLVGVFLDSVVLGAALGIAIGVGVAVLLDRFAGLR